MTSCMFSHNKKVKHGLLDGKWLKKNKDEKGMGRIVRQEATIGFTTTGISFLFVFRT